MSIEPISGPVIPLSRWAAAQLVRLASAIGSERIAKLSGATLLGERAALNGFLVPGLTSAGGGCRLFPTSDSWVALNLSRRDDRALMPALFEDDTLDGDDAEAIAARMSTVDEAGIVERGREMGLAIAGLSEDRTGSPIQPGPLGCPRPLPPRAAPLVVDLSALWAGPLCSHLLWLAGAEVVKVESRSRPDAMRDGDPVLFARLNQGKASVQLDLHCNADRDALIGLLRRADLVIEAARPRALLQLGIDANQLVGESAGLVWITITGHGVAGSAADWVGFGDDCGVAAGLGSAMLEAVGKPAFVGDAIADPLTGITAATVASQAHRDGHARRYMLSMRDIAADALLTERREDPERLTGELRAWGRAAGRLFAAVEPRAAARVRPLGADNARWLGASRC